MSARWLLGGGLLLVAGLAGVYFYLESTAPRPDPTPPPEVTLGAESSLDEAEEDPVEAKPATRRNSGEPPQKTAVAAKLPADSNPDPDVKLPATPEVARSKPSLTDDVALPEDPAAAKRTPDKQPPQSAGKDDEKLPTDPGPKIVPAAQNAEKKKVVVTDSDKPLFEGWENPAAVVLLTGEMHGYVEPCGCAIVQMGGLARRDDLLRQIREVFKWQATCFDLGGLINRPHRTQGSLKAKFAFAALKDMQYPALAMGVEELKLDLGALLGKPDEIDLLGTNITMPDADGQLKPMAVKSVNNVKIVAATIFGATQKAAAFPNPQQNRDPTGYFAYAPPVETLQKLAAQVKATNANIKILLAHASMKEAEQYAKQFAEFDVILGMGPEDPDPDPKFVGETMLVSAGHKGKSVGVLGFFPNQQKRFRWELIKLDPVRFKNSPRMVQHMREYQDELERDGIAKNLKALAAPNGANFVGAEKCGECHIRAYEKWATTKHAQATASLKKGRKGQEVGWINRIHDPECISCHVTGWHPQEMVPYTSGYVDEKASSHLLGQQCENCHGPGAKHVAAEETFMSAKKKKGEETPEQLALRKERHLDLKVAKSRICVMCHDHDNSPEFKFEKYWEEIKHPWKD